MSQQSVMILVASLAVLCTGHAAPISMPPPPAIKPFPPSLPCPYGKADCDNYQKNGCETDTLSDPMNCGKCGAVCEERYGYVSVCNEGKCDFACKVGYADCNDSGIKDGCETYIGGDEKNCGACGVLCKERPGYFTSCENGTCVYVDQCTLIDCPSYPNALTTCTAGNCNTTCALGYADCNQYLPKDGCEVKVHSDNHNCGACGVKCELDRPGFITSCIHGMCVYADKCIVTLCLSYLNAETSCKEGICKAPCSPGYADCNQNLQKDGCEINVNTDNHNCGACGKECLNFSVCSDGICVDTI